ncbi:MAG: hypothetical protein ACREQ5_07400 [Candidatus Dormibacteria bacterium]
MRVHIGKYPGIKSKRERVQKVTIDDYDVWSLDHTLALIIAPALVKLKECKHGAPLVDDTDVPEELRSTAPGAKKPDAQDGDVDDNTFKRWDWVLEEMIWTMTEIANNNPGEEQYYSGYPSKDFKLDREGYEAYHTRIERGCMIFGKYFRGLWD